ncbi:hypothetical protein FJNA_21640 [Thermus sp. FJN-A]
MFLIFGYTENIKALTSLSKRGQITLPAEVRQALGLKPGDTLVVRVEAGRVVLEPAVVLPVELYTEERIREFAENAQATPEELDAFRRAWGL